MPKITLNAPYSITHGNVTQSLTDAEGRLVWAFMCRERMSTNQMAHFIWGEGWNWPERHTRNVHLTVCKLRKKLEPFGWSISRGRKGVSFGNDAKRFLERVVNNEKIPRT